MKVKKVPNRILVDVEENYEIPLWIDKVEPFLQTVMKTVGFDGQEFSVLFCSDEYIKNLNSEYRNIDEPTDVLSFESGDSYADEYGTVWKCTGDIAISLDMLAKNAEYFEVSEDEELKRLLIHGILHLNGYDHGDEHVQKNIDPECEMLKIQKSLMQELQSVHVIG
ncbi:MAG: rRNA maturation RNase YbeY [Treponema sp.]|nr:rRNA maturation RNase YbeY [Treponema sp.]